MKTFFQKLRDIQKKERATGTLSEIDDSFYDDASNYLQELLKIVDDNPLSLEAYQLRDAQRITVEIRERREVKIISTAISNVQKSHDIFKGHKKDSQLYDEIPYNVTPEEEKLYKDVINTIINNREDLMTEIIPHRNKDTKIGFKPNKISEDVEEDSVKESVTNNQQDNITKVDKSVSNNVETKKPHKLTESEIVELYGQVPDIPDIAKNEPKPKTDITTPFTPPKVPKEDTVSLQNNPPKNEVIKAVDSKKDSLQEHDDEEVITDTKEDISSQDDTVPQEENIVSDDEYNSEELVVFREEITTDILDENEKTYGPFKVSDIVLLPQSIVRILDHRHVIDIIE